MTIITIGVQLALLASLCYGLQVLVVERGLNRGGTALAGTLVSIVVSVIVFWGLVLARADIIFPDSLRQVAPFIAAGLMYPILFRLLYYESIDRIGPSVPAAITATNPAIAALIAISVFGEPVTVNTIAGLGCILCGGIVLQVVRSSSDENARAIDVVVQELTRASRDDLLLPIIATLIVGSAVVLIDVGLSSFPHPLMATAITQAVTLVTFSGILAISHRVRSETFTGIGRRGTLVPFIGSGILVAGAWLSYFFALRDGSVLLVVPLVATYPLVVVAGSYFRARQVPRSPRMIAAVSIMLVGVVLIQLP